MRVESTIGIGHGPSGGAGSRCDARAILDQRRLPVRRHLKHRDNEERGGNCSQAPAPLHRERPEQSHLAPPLRAPPAAGVHGGSLRRSQEGRHLRPPRAPSIACDASIRSSTSARASSDDSSSRSTSARSPSSSSPRLRCPFRIVRVDSGRTYYPLLWLPRASVCGWRGLRNG